MEKLITHMKNQCFANSQLARCFSPSDFYYDSELGDDEYRGTVIQKAIKCSDFNFKDNISLQKIQVNGKSGYKVTCLSEKLILRRCVENIKNFSNPFIYNRTQIARVLSSTLREASPYRIYRLDIKSFFESIDFHHIENTLNSIEGLSKHTINLTLGFLKLFNEQFANGLPRGVEISSILADLTLSSFDQKIKVSKNVFYYSRYVDDIIIITSRYEDKQSFMRWMADNLPKGLIFHHHKKFIKDIPNHKKSKGETGLNILEKFDFLGYEYSIFSDLNSKSDGFRIVNIDIAQYKVKEFKTKIVKAFYSYYKQRDFYLLKQRIIFLTTNRDLRERNKKKIIPTGIYYNYSCIDHDSKSLTNLDNFLKMMIDSTKIRIGKLMHGSLTSMQRRELHKIQFSNGFENRVYKKYSLNQLQKIAQVWK